MIQYWKNKGHCGFITRNIEIVVIGPISTTYDIISRHRKTVNIESAIRR